MDTYGVEINEVDAKGGRKKKGMTYVLGISLASIIALGLAIFLAFAI